VWTIVVAGGAGRRFGAAKQFEMLGRERVIDRACAVARSVSEGLVVVLPSTGNAVAWLPVGDSEHAVAGGATRSGSVRAGLAAVPGSATVVCVHDAARPLASRDLFERVIAAVRAGADGAIPGMPVNDTIKVVDDDGVVTATLDRATLTAVQTPQAFSAAALRAAHAAAAEGTDDASLVEATGGRVVVVPGEAWNRKLTEPGDLEWARSYVAQAER
jgi:2-C-methyl-D-erythritol 4-phosphate cytidylyltransferase